MSEMGWKSFLGAEGVEDWVVLHGGAATVFRTDGFAEGAKLVLALSQLSGMDSSGLIMSLAGHQLSVRLTRDIWSLELEHIQMARAISQTARAFGAVADRSAVQEVQIAIASKRETTNLQFWRAVLGYQEMAEDNGVDPLGHGSTVWMQEIDSSKALRHAMHIDVSVAREHIEDRLAAALAAGGRIVDASEAPGYWTLSDPAGNRVCICAWPDGKTQGLDGV